MASPKLKITIRRAAFTNKVKERIEFNLKTVGMFLINALEAQVSTPYPPASRVGESPHRRTGTLRGGFKMVIKRRLFSVDLRVFTNVPYSRRLEFGFIGTDRLGRNINQGPRPYFRVAIAKTNIGRGVAKDP